ncbi:M50 family metallopeptidase [Pseudarthrobacter sp. N5]|uniref:M50 family metallopeptidase n=1 Tax=Pseudarthrobacter sp. N5 TaxID=3418416 RepID=UPI003CE779B5
MANDELSGVPGDLWQKFISGFGHAEIPAVSIGELIVVILIATVLSIPRSTWKYFGLLATVAHELGHAFAALMSGQRLGGITLRLDHSGTTMSFSRGRFPAVWSGFWGYPVPALTGAAMVLAGFNGWGPAAMSLGAVILLAALVFVRNAVGILIVAAASLLAAVLVLLVPAHFTGHVVIVLGLALLVAAVRDLGKLLQVHLRRRDQLPTSDAYLLYRATSIPSVIWIVLFAALVGGSWFIAWQPVSRILTAAT